MTSSSKTASWWTSGWLSGDSPACIRLCVARGSWEMLIFVLFFPSRWLSSDEAFQKVNLSYRTEKGLSLLHLCCVCGGMAERSSY